MPSQAEQRGLAQAKLRTNKHGDIWFFNTHLSAAGFSNGENGTTERTQQVGCGRGTQLHADMGTLPRVLPAQ